MANSLKITFSREGTAEDVHVAADGAAALMSALRIIAGQDELRAGDKLSVERRGALRRICRGIFRPACTASRLPPYGDQHTPSGPEGPREIDPWKAIASRPGPAESKGHIGVQRGEKIGP
jgi:hypothetical protein